MERSEDSTYVRVCEIAQGGMGTVDLALRHEGQFRRLYAIKRLHPHLQADAEVRTMFLDEARIAGLLSHPNVLSVLDVGQDDEGPFLIMDFVEGVDLGKLITLAEDEAEASVPIQICLRIAIDVARGLHAAHELTDHKGTSLDLVHRDLSPQNVLIGYDGAVRIADFGIAKALGRNTRTSTGVLKGKMAYMSPEQLRFEEPDRRSDMFALGVILYELLSGTRLYKNSEGADGARRILNEPPPDIGEVRPEVPAEIVALLFSLLAKDRDDRPSTAATVAQRLEGALAEILTSEEPIDVGEYVSDLARELRTEQKRVLADAIAAAERGDPTIVGHLAPMNVQAAETKILTNQRRSPILAVSVAVAVLLGVAGGVAAFQLTRGEENVSVDPPVPAVEETTENTEASAEPAPEPELVAEEPPEELPPAPATETLEGEAEASDRRPRPGRGRGRDRTMSPMGRSMEVAMQAGGMGLERWEW